MAFKTTGSALVLLSQPTLPSLGLSAGGAQKILKKKKKGWARKLLQRLSGVLYLRYIMVIACLLNQEPTYSRFAPQILAKRTPNVILPNNLYKHSLTLTSSVNIFSTLCASPVSKVI